MTSIADVISGLGTQEERDEKLNLNQQEPLVEQEVVIESKNVVVATESKTSVQASDFAVGEVIESKEGKLPIIPNPDSNIMIPIGGAAKILACQELQARALLQVAGIDAVAQQRLPKKRGRGTNLFMMEQVKQLAEHMSSFTLSEEDED